MTKQTTMFEAFAEAGFVRTDGKPLVPEKRPIARTTDPSTSQDAAADVAQKLTGLRQMFVDALVVIGRPATAQEIAARVPERYRESVRKRAAECVDAGVVRHVGSKKCDVTGKSAAVYWVESDGA